MSRLARERAALVVVDVQEGFRKAVGDFERVAHKSAILVQAARIMGLPILVTEQYPRGLGATSTIVSDQLASVQPLEKTVFSAMRAEGFDLQGRSQALICGLEAHVCVSQTALDLLAAGIEVYIAADAVASRSEDDRTTALARLTGARAIVTSTEAAIFELLQKAGSDEFKTIQKLVL